MWSSLHDHVTHLPSADTQCIIMTVITSTSIHELYITEIHHVHCDPPNASDTSDGACPPALPVSV